MPDFVAPFASEDARSSIRQSPVQRIFEMHRPLFQ